MCVCARIKSSSINLIRIIIFREEKRRNKPVEDGVEKENAECIPVRCCGGEETHVARLFSHLRARVQHTPRWIGRRGTCHRSPVIIHPETSFPPSPPHSRQCDTQEKYFQDEFPRYYNTTSSLPHACTRTHARRKCCRGNITKL